MRDPATMTAGEINKELDKLSKIASAINDEFIAAGRGHERPSDWHNMTGDPLVDRWETNSSRMRALHIEIEQRYGPGAPSRLPTGRGFGPRKRLEGYMAGVNDKRALFTKLGRCKHHNYAHRYNVCAKCGKQYCPYYWSDCPRCQGGVIVDKEPPSGFSGGSSHVGLEVPSIAEVVKELKAIKREIVKGEVSADEPLEIRLQVLSNGQWTVHYGDPGYDTDHHGYWGAGSLSGDEDEGELEWTAREMIEEVEEAAAQDEEGMPDEDLPNDPEFDGNDPSGHVERADKLVVENVTGIAEERGWRLFWWSGKEGDTTAVTESGYATSHPFRTRREAVAYAIRKYGIKPINPPW